MNNVARTRAQLQAPLPEDKVHGSPDAGFRHKAQAWFKTKLIQSKAAEIKWNVDIYIHATLSS